MPNKTKLPGLKNIPPKTERELKLALEDLKQALEIRLGLRGDPLDRAVTLRELKDGNVVKVTNSAVGVSDGIKPPDEDPGDLTVPPNPTGLTAAGAFTSLILKWNLPSYGNHGFTEIWRSQDNNLAGAELVSTAGGQVYSDDVGYAQTYFYWVRFVSTSNIPGSWNDTEGTSAATAANVSTVMSSLSDQLSNMPGFSTLGNDITININGVTSSLNSGLSGIDTTLGTKTQTFVGSSAPTANAVGDLWVHTGQNNKLYRAFSATADQITSGEWQEVSDGSAGITVFAQDNVPTSTSVGDLWFDTNDSNKQYVAESVGADQVTSGEWVLVADTRVATVISDLNTLETAVNDSGTGLSATVARVGTVEAALTGYTGSSAIANKFTAVEATITSNDNDIATNVTDINTLTAALSGYTGSGAISSAFDATNANVTANDGDIATNVSSIEALQTIVGKEFGVRIKTTNNSNTVTIQTVTNSAGSTTTSAHGITATDVTSGSYIAIIGATAVSGITTSQLNRIHKIQSIPSTTSLTITVVGDAANATTTFGDYTATAGNIIGAFAGVAELAQARADSDGNAQASFVLQVAANGSVAGMVIEANASDGGTASAVQFQADKFAIWNGTSGQAPFIVSNNTVFMANAMIQDAAIDTAQIKDLAVDNAKISSLDGDKITANSIDASKINGGVIQSTDLDNGSTTIIHGSVIETGSINADRIVTGEVVVPNDLGQSGSTTIHGSRIATGTIDADKIDVTDLVLPTVHNKVSGATIGGFPNNVMTVQEVGSIGTVNGIYDGFVRIFGGANEVKTLSFFIGDGAFGAGNEIDSTGNAYNNAPNTQNLPMVDVGGVQYHSNRAVAWSGIDRFQTTQAVCQLSVSFRKRSGTSRTAKLYILAQGDGGTRFLNNVEYSFSRQALNEPAQFEFSPVTGAATNTTITSGSVTITGSGFSSGTITASGFGSPKISIGTGSFLTGSQTVTDGQSIRIQMTTGSQNNQEFTCVATIGGVSANFRVTTVAGSPPPPPTPPPGPPPPSNPPGENPGIGNPASP